MLFYNHSRKLIRCLERIGQKCKCTVVLLIVRIIAMFSGVEVTFISLQKSLVKEMRTSSLGKTLTNISEENNTLLV